MSLEYFNNSVRPRLDGYNFTYSSFSNGEFGDLERIEIEGCNKLGTVEFWSKGWLGIDVYDCSLDDQVMNVLLSPEENKMVEGLFVRLLEILGAV